MGRIDVIATWAGLNHEVIFISLQNNHYIIKNFSKGGFATISMRDEKNAQKFIANAMLIK
ncbi:MAG: hypothetical protein WAM14_26535 [Candidatus Nitrosopolaris sp.]